MNIHKYLLPASLAAAMHVALLWLMPEGNGIVAPPVDPRSAGAFPEVANDPPPVPLEDPETDFDPVRTLTGGPALPGLDEPVPPMTKVEFTVPVPARPKGPETGLDRIPEIVSPGGPGTGGMGPIHSGIFDLGKLDRMPRAKVQPAPDYPSAMKQSGTGGSVVVVFEVDTVGVVQRAEAISFTHREFVEPALRAVRRWRFEPGRRHDQAVRFRLVLPIEFGIEQE
jgi:protein TonB